MEIMTKTMGNISIEQKQVFDVPHGLFGFEDYHSYAMIDAEKRPFIWFQSIENKNLAFLLIDPFIVCKNYELDIDDESLSSIGVSSPADVLVMAIVTIPADNSPVTVNLQGPLIINKNNNKCIQIISSDSRWMTKHDILAEMKRG